MAASIWDRLKEVSDQQTRRRRRTPVARAAPRPRGTAPGPIRMPGDPGYGTGPDIRRRSPPGSTSSKVRVNPTTGRVTQPRYRRPAPVDPEYAAIRRDVSRARRAPVERITGVEQAGFDPSRYIGTGGRSIPGFIKNLSRGALDIVTSVPASAQLVGEAALYPVVSGYNLATGNSNPTARRTERALRTHLDAAGAGIAEDYKYRWGPLFEGEFGRFGERFYEDPLPTILDVAGGKAAVGRAPNVVRRATRAVAPESRAGMRASRALSTLSAEERAQVARIFGTDIEPGPGGRYRPPRKVTSRVARDEEGKPNVGERTIEVPRRPYSGDATARARQKAVDRLRGRVASRVERFAESRQLASGTRASGRTRLSASAAAKLTSEAKYARVQKRQTRDIQDLFRAKAEVEQARTMPDAAKAIKALRRDKNVSGRPMPGLSIEEAAFALHRMDILGDVTDGPRGRGGLTARQLRDQAVRRWEGGQRAARATGKRTEVARQQLEAIRQVPDELLELTDTKNPAVRRVIAAVEEARKLDVESQRKSVEAGVVKTRTVAEAASRDSAIAVGGARWGGDAIRAVTVRARKKTRGLKRRIAAAQKRGDKAEVRRLKAELARHIRNTKGRIEAIRRDATKDTPELRKARADRAEAEAKLSEARKSGKPREIEAATRARDTYFKRLRKQEREALGFTSPRRPELVGKRGVYVPDTPADKRLGFTGPRRAGRFSGPDQARQSQGRLKGRLGMDLNPALVLHQARRATENYTGTISAKALDELIASAAYIDPRTGKFLTGNRLRLLSSTDAERVALVHKGNLEKALKRLDTLDEGDFLPEDIARAAVLDDLPDGANASDYIAIHKDAADVWREAMTSSHSFFRVTDKALNYWKGGLLALSPRWYVNNMFGLGLQYAVMAGTDIRSIVKANRSKGIRRAMEQRSPQAIKDTLASDLTGSRDIPRIMEFGFKTNAKIEEAWRRAAFYNRAKKRLRDERGKFRDLSDAEIARAIENMPESMAREIVSDVEFFIGNYRKFNKVERDVLKRVLPFYSWLRVIGRLTLALPFRSPVRAQALAVLETASTAGINPNDKALPYYMRGSLRFGDKAVPTWSINPFQTLAPMVAAAGARQPAGAMAEEALGWVHPIAQLGVSQATGVNNFGRGVSTPPGTAMFGQDPEAMNPVTGLPESQRARIPIDEALLQSAIPGQAGVIRKLAGAGRTPYDTTRTLDVISDAIQSIGGGERDPLLYRPESKKKGRTPAGINWITSGVGVPIYNQDDGSLTREARQALREFKAEMKKLEAQQRRARRRG